MINRLLVEGLYGKLNFDLRFHPDLNLLTGRNGSGKTTLMKLMWGAYSARFIASHYFPRLETFTLNTSHSFIFFGERTTLESKHPKEFGELEFLGSRGEMVFGEVLTSSQNPNFIAGKRGEVRIDKIQFGLGALNSKSLFFPTFRRSEGGYEFLEVHQPQGISPESDPNLTNIIRAASNGPTFYHAFVNYTSTLDIDFLLSSLHSSILGRAQQLEQEQSEYALKLIGESGNPAEEVLQTLRQKLEETKARVRELMRPLDGLSEMIARLFHGKGVQINQSLTLGETINLLHTEHLSSGEKQMLGLIVYSAICKNAVIFIDEPELSLSPDWQRMLVPMLLEVSEGCQFFLATHSPFIYSQFPDKDIFLDQDKGEV